MDADNVGLEDRLAIQDLLSRYCHAMDSARADLTIELFTDDATLDTSVGGAQDKAGILEWIEGRLALRAPDYQVGHYLLNTLIAATGPNAAKVRSMMLYTRQRRDGGASAELIGTGIYEDEMRKEQGRWKFSARRVSIGSAVDDVYFK